MNKLSLDALRERAEAVASEDLLATISGGTENACHFGDTLRDILNSPSPKPAPKYVPIVVCDNI